MPQSLLSHSYVSHKYESVRTGGSMCFGVKHECEHNFCLQQPPQATFKIEICINAAWSKGTVT